MFHVSKSWKESKNSGAVFGKCFHRNGCGLVKNKGFKITQKYWNIKNVHFEPPHRNLFCYLNSENAKVFKYFRKFLSEDLTGSWPMPEMNHLSTTREGHLNHLIFRLFIKMKKNHEWSWIELNPSWIGKLSFCQILIRLWHCWIQKMTPITWY